MIAPVDGRLFFRSGTAIIFAILMDVLECPLRDFDGCPRMPFLPASKILALTGIEQRDSWITWTFRANGRLFCRLGMSFGDSHHLRDIDGCPRMSVVHLPVSSHKTSAFPETPTGRRFTIFMLVQLQHGNHFEAAVIRLSSSPQICSPPRSLLP